MSLIKNKNMEEQNNQGDQKINQPIKKKKKSIKLKISLVIIIILIGVGIYGYYWYRQTNALRVEAQAVVDKAEQFNVLENSITVEKERCEQFIARQEGDFGSFEYCQKFIDWVDSLPNFQQ